jgi:hypothetical protein
MECLQSRIDSFSKTKRVKNPSKPSSNITLKWPHPESFKATPDTLAEAGFYYDPSADDPDNVSCFMCEKELGGWEEDDDPFDIHYDKCAQKCGWANTRCGLRRDMDRHGRYVHKSYPTICDGESNFYVDSFSLTNPGCLLARVWRKPDLKPLLPGTAGYTTEREVMGQARRKFVTSTVTLVLRLISSRWLELASSQRRTIQETTSLRVSTAMCPSAGGTKTMILCTSYTACY